MAKKEPSPTKPEAGNNKSRIIKIIIMAGTFLSIAVLSIITRGQNGGWPSTGVIIIRIALLSLCTIIYFLMLYYTQAGREKDSQKPQPGKK